MLRGDKLGEGTFGIVYSAQSPTSHKTYALKRNLAEEETSFIGSPRELDVLNKIRKHPHIIKLERVSFGDPFISGCFSPLQGDDRKNQRNDSIHYIFKQANCDLHRFIYGVQGVNFNIMKRYMVQLLLGLEYVHGHNIIHRDLKPSNVLLFGDENDVLGTANIAKICDFGLAKPYTYQGIQTPRTVTSWYRAPEIALHYPHYDYKSDVWSMGCMFFEMIAKAPFIMTETNDDDEIIKAILTAMPTQLKLKKYRELIKSNKWRDVNIGKYRLVRNRKSFIERFGLTEHGLDHLQTTSGNIENFVDLLNNMLIFEWDDRYTVTQCLNHNFFDEFRPLIDETRKMYPPKLNSQLPIKVKDCIERKWMAELVKEIFNNRSNFEWYSDRIIFQAMDIYDRYLSGVLHECTIQPNAVESQYKGLIHDKYNSDLRFMVCIYLSFKYFSSLQCPISYDDVVADQFKTDQAKLIAEAFEGGLIKNSLEYEIYRPTLYESADYFGDRLDDCNIRDLIILYTMNISISGLTPIRVYEYYRTHLKNKNIDILLNPVDVIPK